MEPIRDTKATLVDLLERVLDKGVVLHADIIIHVAGVPLLGLSLKACIAGMETMLRYGIWQDWDEAQRTAVARELQRKKRIPLEPGENILFKTFASCCVDNGLYRTWKSGYLFATDTRLLLFRSELPETLFQCFYDEIQGVDVGGSLDTAGAEDKTLEVTLRRGTVTILRSVDAQKIKATIRERVMAFVPDPLHAREEAIE